MALEFLEKIKRDNDFLRTVVSIAYELPWRTAMENVDKLIESCETLDSALTLMGEDRDYGYELADMAKAELDKLQDAESVLINMLRGNMAKVSASSLYKLYNEDELLEAARAAAQS